MSPLDPSTFTSARSAGSTTHFCFPLARPPFSLADARFLLASSGSGSGSFSTNHSFHPNHPSARLRVCGVGAGGEGVKRRMSKKLRPSMLKTSGSYCAKGGSGLEAAACILDNVVRLLGVHIGWQFHVCHLLGRPAVGGNWGTTRIRTKQTRARLGVG